MLKGCQTYVLYEYLSKPVVSASSVDKFIIITFYYLKHPNIDRFL